MRDASFRVIVLAGGLSAEREVSLRSGRRVADALAECGHETSVYDVDPALLAALRRDRPDCVVSVLHGGSGEGGALQEILELAGMPFVGARASAARVAFDKPIAKQVVSRAGVRTPPSVTLPADTFRELGAGEVLDAVVSRLGMPLFVKPATGGSALGCVAVERPEDLAGAMVSCFAYGAVALVERFVRGTEVAVPVVDLDGGSRPLPAVEIRADGGVYDYTARYTPGATEFVVPAGLDPAIERVCADVAVTAHRSLGLRDLSRADLIVDHAGEVWFLESNVSPGMTDTSLVPLAVESYGLTLAQLYGDLVSKAVARGPDV